ncbi:LysR family transcriptional regulator [Nocardioides massiliensis]|uniref:DNA-binding transcriptional LysR family regulator n=1 Tax=Nocardioides massiliensis TaxID=1325935 RepID=A0ABT9NTA7_9ACTN|nr:LysR family transcriptional regulator [Nocardioides massiliensis]MDP9823647.1 DNA-binding transcriptional LysR family regulator [Nocardioides massiliensis]
MELRQLQYFIAVAREGTFLGAAANAGVAQPTLWRQVRALERELGVTLFERTGRSVRITSAGTQLLPHASKLLAQASSLHALGSSLSKGQAGVVTMSCAHPHVQRFLAPLIGSFHSEEPNVHVALHESADLPQIDRVLTGESDFVTTLLRTENGLDGCLLGVVRLVLVVPDDHPWRHKNSITTAELQGQPILTGRPGGLTRHLLEPALVTGGIKVNYVLESANATSVVAMAREGLGIGVLADDNLQPHPNAPWPVLLDEAHSMAAQVWVYWSSEHALTAAARGFARHLQQSTGVNTRGSEEFLSSR